MSKEKFSAIVCTVCGIGFLITIACAVFMDGKRGKEAPNLDDCDDNIIEGDAIIKSLKIDDCADGIIEGNFIITSPTFDDLLDAIEWVESKGDPNAVGDYLYFSTYFDANDFRTDANDCIYIDLGGMVFDANSEEIVVVDIVTTPGGKIKIYIPQAIGAYQIHKIYVDDVNRIYKGLAKSCESEVYPKYTYEDRWDKDHSRMMARTYMFYYLNKICWGTKAEFNALQGNFEIMARIHNGGPDGWKKKSTEKYWLKIQKAMER